MNKLAWILGFTLVVLGGITASRAESPDGVENYGVYVAGTNGYVKIKPYQHRDNFVDFKYLHEIPAVMRNDGQLQLLIYQKNFSAKNFAFELRPIDVTVDIKQVSFDIKPLPAADMYALTLRQPVLDGSLLQVHSGSFFIDNFGVIMLGDPQQQLVNYFSQKNLDDAQAAQAYLNDALQAFPENTELNKLQRYWATTAASSRDRKDYSYVEEQWTKYQSAEKIDLKVRYLDNLIREVNGYIQQHPQGTKIEEAQERKRFAESKIDEFKDLL